MNSGRPVWHASIARWVRYQLVPTSRWGEGVIREAKRKLAGALYGVGREPSVLAMKKISLQMRRSLTDAEIAMLSPEWLAIPARDEFSEDGEIEMQL